MCYSAEIKNKKKKGAGEHANPSWGIWWMLWRSSPSEGSHRAWEEEGDKPTQWTHGSPGVQVKSKNGQVRTHDAERGWGAQREQKRITGFTSKEFCSLFSLATVVISSILLFLWTIKVCTVPVKSSFTGPGKPLLYGWGGLFRGHKNKGTYFQGTPLLTFCWAHTPANFPCPGREHDLCTMEAVEFRVSGSQKSWVLVQGLPLIGWGPSAKPLNFSEPWILIS